ncbi:MAG: DUF2334 domain-containing protein [Methylococcaceae bacterium]|nr:DUF2334 domain-containing protein [Methylococcaceae bacterium]
MHLKTYRFVTFLGFALWAQADLLACGIDVILRYDDYSTKSPTHIEKQLFEAAKSVDGSILVGIVPFPDLEYPQDDETDFLPPEAPLSETKRELIETYHRQRVVTYALHGYSHKNNLSAESLSNGGMQSEFAVLNPQRQKNLLRIGKAALETQLSAPLDIFIPPFNSYDESTLGALRQTGFKLLSASIHRDIVSQGLEFLPAPTLYPQYLREVTLKALSRHEHGTILVTLHPYDFVGSNTDFPSYRKSSGSPMTIAQFREDLEYLKAQGINFISIESLRAKGVDLSAERLLANRPLSYSFIIDHGVVPNWLVAPPMPEVYRSAEDANHDYLKILLSATVLHGLIALLSASISRLLWLRLTGYPRLRTAGLFAVIAAAGYVALYGYKIGFYSKISLIGSILTGALLGIGMGCFHSSRARIVLPKRSPGDFAAGMHAKAASKTYKSNEPFQ